MIMAHGDPSGCLAVSGGLMFYDDIVKCLADCINNQTKSFEFEHFIEWGAKLFIDACYSGSAINKTIEWVKKNGGYSSVGEQYDIDYFECECYLELEIFTACSSDEPSWDQGEGYGGIWVNHFIGKGDLGDQNSLRNNFEGEILTTTNENGEVVKQHTQILKIAISYKK